ncbi:MAG TPA: hypothetical protein PLE77_05850 [Kiritimatiellia bacterium]|nr:hypothetical protein [Kiritimatiellia bacterium]
MRVRWLVFAGLVLAVTPCLSEEVSEVGLLENAGFEFSTGGGMPEGWTYYTTGLEHGGLATNAASGSQCARLTTQATPGAFQGFFQVRPVEAGVHYRVTARAKSDPAAPLDTNAYLQLVVEWHDWAGIEITRHWSANFDASFLNRQSWWMLPGLYVAAPEGAVEGVFGFHLFDGAGGCTGTVLVDDFSVEVSPGAGQCLARQDQSVAH